MVLFFSERAVAVLKGNNGVTGTVWFLQRRAGGPIRVKVDVRGLRPNSRHGFHVHQLGDLTNGCTSAGPHYNPGNNNHGGPTDPIRHVGDLGNIVSNSRGIARVWLRDNQVMIDGMKSVIGRAVVVHANVDDLGEKMVFILLAVVSSASVGRGTGAQREESLRTGNAGPRLACGVIGIAS
ncbi:copper/zinc superoxide dismutase [Ancylostoma duodenale]|uniref:Superoxide dismutase [Cu-Zn] n=1 Tax=Ancylostoma duodenale TaxID=51022 RepID=A0A0C2F2E6_9BILA|nr:copper/zinc superoxide dismutase [Ancylostoma duodenale]